MGGWVGTLKAHGFCTRGRGPVFPAGERRLLVGLKNPGDSIQHSYRTLLGNLYIAKKKRILNVC